MGEVIILNKIFPEWRPHSSFINDHLERALQLDAQRSSHPIQVDCPDAAMINQVGFSDVVNSFSVIDSMF
jgi:aminopeptidase 2